MKKLKKSCVTFFKKVTQNVKKVTQNFAKNAKN